MFNLLRHLKGIKPIVAYSNEESATSCLAMILSYYGHFYPVNYLNEFSGVNRDGLTVAKFIQAATKLGLDCSYIDVNVFELNIHCFRIATF